jgi:hypothetical protein
MVDSFIMRIDWITVAMVIGVLISVIAALVYIRPNAAAKSTSPGVELRPPWKTSGVFDGCVGFSLASPQPSGRPSSCRPEH